MAGFRAYSTGLLPRDRNKTLTGLDSTEPVVGAQHAAVRRPQFSVAESTWDSEQVDSRRVESLPADLTTAPHGNGVLVIDDCVDRKARTATVHRGKRYLGSVGKPDRRGAAVVTTRWTDASTTRYATAPAPRPSLPEGQGSPGLS